LNIRWREQVMGVEEQRKGGRQERGKVEM